eukprot:TRINITY_DN9381_c0_g1_i1.p1 TRINITY_DN9381_c0_g1~~TRINITY_DN9381_c0_g1_i1.p1  ORF type:complete len:128 (+),score=33.74 TRINITY_DN9381_c0_g1_i1:24-407(+)
MSYSCTTNVWGNFYRQNREKSRAKVDSRNNFGESSGPQSLPAFNTFQNKTSSSSGKINSELFGSEAKHFNWGGSQSNIKSSSASSSKTSSPLGSNNDLDKRLDWGRMVDNVLKEEIRKMAEGYRNGK